MWANNRGTHEECFGFVSLCNDFVTTIKTT